MRRVKQNILARSLQLSLLFVGFFQGIANMVVAQPTKADSIWVLQDGRVIDVYSSTGNAATITGNYPRFGYAGANVRYESGDFKRPMEPQSFSSIGLSTGGSTNTGKWKLLAHFQYQKKYDRRLAWAAVNDPYSGNPFIWADSSSGNWDRDEVLANIAAARRVGRRWEAGVAVDYNIGSGARTNEPKPFYRTRDISLSPGVTYRLSQSAKLGLSGSVGFIQEENEIGYYSNSNVLLYRLRGYGTFSKSPFVSGERKQKGTRWQGGLHFNRRWKKYELLVHAAVAQRDEEVFEGVAQTQTTGYFTRINWSGAVQVYMGTAAKGGLLNIRYEQDNGYADDMIFRAESASFIRQTLQARLAAWKQKDMRRLRQWSIAPSLRFVDYTDQASYMQFTTTTLGSLVEFNYRQALGSRFNLQLRPAAGYYHVLDNNFSTRVQQVIVRELIMPDFAYFRSNYWNTSCQLELQMLSGNQLPSHLVRCSGNIQWSDEKNLSNRVNYQLQYLILF